MQEIPISKNKFINCHWEVFKGKDFITYDVVTCNGFYKPKDLKKDRTPKKNAISKKFTIARCLHEDLAEHIVEAHNEFMKF